MRTLVEMLTLTVLTPEKTLLQADGVGKVRLRLVDGAWLSIYPRHAPLIAETASGVAQYVTNEGEAAIAIGPGVLYVSPGRVLILTGYPEEAAAEGEVLADAEQLRFERLAQVLVATLQAQREPDAAQDEASDTVGDLFRDIAEEA